MGDPMRAIPTIRDAEYPTWFVYARGAGLLLAGVPLWWMIGEYIIEPLIRAGHPPAAVWLAFIIGAGAVVHVGYHAINLAYRLWRVVPGWDQDRLNYDEPGDR